MLVTLNKRAILLGVENKLRVDEHTTDSHGGNTKIFFRNLAQHQKSAKLASLFCFDKSIKINQFH